MKKLIAFLMAAMMLLSMAACGEDETSTSSTTTVPGTSSTNLASNPTTAPTTEPTTVPTTDPTTAPTGDPTGDPTTAPTTAPTDPTDPTDASGLTTLPSTATTQPTTATTQPTSATTQSTTAPVAPHTHSIKRTSAALRSAKCETCGVAMPVYNLGYYSSKTDYDSLYVVVNEDNSIQSYYEYKENNVYEDNCWGEFVTVRVNYDPYIVMEVSIDTHDSYEKFRMMFYIQDGKLKHITQPAGQKWTSVPEGYVDAKEIFCSDGEYYKTYSSEFTTDEGYLVATQTDPTGVKQGSASFYIQLHTPTSKDYWRGPTLLTYYRPNYSVAFGQKAAVSTPFFQDSMVYNETGDYYTLIQHRQLDQFIKCYTEYGDGYSVMLVGTTTPKYGGYYDYYLLYADMTCEQIPFEKMEQPSKELFKGDPWGKEFLLMSNDNDFESEYHVFTSLIFKTDGYTVRSTVRYVVYLVADAKSTQPYFKRKLTTIKPE